MSLNTCQINGFTINAICADRRRAIIDSLLPKEEGGHASVQRINPFTRQIVDDVVEVDNLELPQIRVSVLLNGKEYFEVQDRADAAFVPAISVAALRVNPDIIESVSVFDMQSREINDSITLNITDILVRSFDNEQD